MLIVIGANKNKQNFLISSALDSKDPQIHGIGNLTPARYSNATMINNATTISMVPSISFLLENMVFETANKK